MESNSAAGASAPFSMNLDDLKAHLAFVEEVKSRLDKDRYDQFLQYFTAYQAQAGEEQGVDSDAKRSKLKQDLSELFNDDEQDLVQKLHRFFEKK